AQLQNPVGYELQHK
nr:RecName: Full=Unknown protein 6 from 2D-PAGE [Fructilactobacillus sanfranciscensis]